jgi:L-iditol 2-dehydrogenase
VAGQGPIGLMFTRLLALQGMRVVATDLLPKRLELAREFGAAAVYRPECQVLGLESKVRSPLSKAQSPKSKVQPPASASTHPASRLAEHTLTNLVHQLTRGRGLDAAVIAVPSDSVVREAQAMVRGAGQVLLFSHTRRGDQTSLDLATVCVDEKDLVGSYSADFRLQAEVARLVFTRKLDASRLITHRFPLDQTAAAIKLASQPVAESLKIVVAQGRLETSG